MARPESNEEQIAYWNGDVGAKWVKAQDRLDAMLAAASAALLKAAAVRAGERVLDIGCGCGDTSLQLAAKGARVTGVDISAPMITRAGHRAREASLDVEFLQADASMHSFPAPFDLLFSRFGVMFFADPVAAFANLKKSLKPSGRLAFVCWRDWRENEWVRETVAAVRPHAPPQPQSDPEAPGPFAFADAARVQRILSSAGFERIDTRAFDAQLPFGGTLDDAVAHVREFGPVSRMLTDASDAQRSAATSALREALKPFAQHGPLTMGGAMWIVTAAGEAWL